MLHLKVNDLIAINTFTERDAIALFQVINDNKRHLRAWIPWIDQIKEEKDVLELIKMGTLQMERQQSISLGLFQDHKIIGAIEMQNWQQDLKKASIGYWLVKDEEGKGIMFQTASVFLEYLFVQVGLNKVELNHLLENSRSAALANRLGFKIEGILRDSLLINGRLCDKVVQGLLRKEFKIG